MCSLKVPGKQEAEKDIHNGGPLPKGKLGQMQDPEGKPLVNSHPQWSHGKQARVMVSPVLIELARNAIAAGLNDQLTWEAAVGMFDRLKLGNTHKLGPLAAS